MADDRGVAVVVFRAPDGRLMAVPEVDLDGYAVDEAQLVLDGDDDVRGFGSLFTAATSGTSMVPMSLNAIRLPVSRTTRPR